MQRRFFMRNFINDSERNSIITRGLDYHSRNTRSNEIIDLLDQIRTGDYSDPLIVHNRLEFPSRRHEMFTF